MSLIPGFAPATEDKPRRSRKRRLFYGLLVLVAIFAAVFGWAYWHGNKVIRDAIAEVERTDPHWRIDQIEANRRSMADEVNSALVIINGKKLIDNSARVQSAENDLGNMFDDIHRFPNARLNDEQKTCLAVVLKPYRAALDEWYKIEHMPHGRFPIKYTPDFIGTILQGTQEARDTARTLSYDLMERVEAGDRPGAARAMICLFHSARAVGDEPLLISVLVRIAIQAIAINKLEWLMAQLQLDESTLAKLQKTLEEDSREPLLTNACRGERAGTFQTFEHMKKNPGYIAAIGGFAGMGGPRWRIMDYFLAMLPGSMATHQADSLRFLTRAVEISKLPIEQHLDAFGQLEKEMPNLSLLARLLVPASTKVCQASIRSQAQARCAIVALAAERFRLKHERWPNQLTDLVADGLLSEVPNDPFDGKPLRWVQLPDGRLVYSVGMDRTDNQGHINRDNIMAPGSDMGFRVFNVDQRRQPPRPPKPKIPDPPDG